MMGIKKRQLLLFFFCFCLILVYYNCGGGDGGGTAAFDDNGGSTNNDGGNNGGNKGDIEVNSVVPDVIENEEELYLCFTANTAGSTVSTSVFFGTLGRIPSLEWSYDGENWNPFIIGDTIVVLENKKDKVYLRGDNNYFSGYGFNEHDIYDCTIINFSLTGSIAASGNIMSLVDKSLQSKTIPCDYCFTNLFLLCSSLTRAPVLPAINLTNNCYDSMFTGCFNLAKAPELPATKLADHCYYNMFANCRNLIEVPSLPATTLKDYCYCNMFTNCFCLTKAPELPATTLADSCYYAMFMNCAITDAPILPAITLARYCYAVMFNGCSNLTNITAYFNAWSPADATDEWVNCVADSGTFKCPNSLPNTRGVNNIPSAWVKQNL